MQTATLLSVPKEFIQAFIEVSGCATGGDRGDTLYVKVYNARKKELTSIYTNYIRSRNPHGLDFPQRMRSYRNFIEVSLMADND